MASKRSSSPSAYRKPCSICEKPRDVLVRCRIDDTMQWNFVCPGSCWREVSGGVVDGTEDKPNYVYGGNVEEQARWCLRGEAQEEAQEKGHSSYQRLVGVSIRLYPE